MKKYLKIETERDAYSKGEISSNSRNMTVRQLINYLEDFADEDATVLLSFDNGYTYGGVREINIEPIEEPEEGIDDIEEYIKNNE